MKISLVTILLFSFLACACADKKPEEPTFGIVIHGGMGYPEGKVSPKDLAETEKVMLEALKAGHRILEAGGDSMDAVNAAIVIMEDSAIFNAGKGAVFTNEGTHELDASIMDGSSLNVGSVIGVKHTKNPINLARLVMEQSKHVMMVGDGAETFGKAYGIELVDPEYFSTPHQKAALERAQAKQKEEASTGSIGEQRYYGTVGAVAVDQSGNLAAGTSTGGMTNKRFGRVGDSPIIGAGCYASNDSCAVSATGHGEYFIRLTIARDIAALVEYKGLSVEEASRLVIQEKLKKLGGRGGVIAIDREGNLATTHNTGYMRRAYVDSNGNFVVKFGKD